MEDKKDYEKALKEMIEQYKRSEKEYGEFWNFVADRVERIDKEPVTKEEREKLGKRASEVGRNYLNQVHKIQDFLSESGILEIKDSELKKELQILRNTEKARYEEFVRPDRSRFVSDDDREEALDDLLSWTDPLEFKKRRREFGTVIVGVSVPSVFNLYLREIRGCYQFNRRIF